MHFSTESITDYFKNMINPTPIPENSDNRVEQWISKNRSGMEKLVIKGITYYTIPSTGQDTEKMGASKKLLLISENSLIKALDNSQYSDDVGNLENKIKINPDAIIKFKEPLNEMMALGLSKSVYGLNTSKGEMIAYNGSPALFVEFDPMDKLSTVASGVKQVRSDGKTVHNHSTLTPIGEGLQSNLFVDDFGSAFGLMYLCGDADAVGAYNQNKGIQGRSLFVLDQAIKTHKFPNLIDLFDIDTSFRQRPSTKLGARIRHTNGRNFSLLEDASLSNKYDSLSPEKLNSCRQYCKDVIAGLEAKKNNVPKELRKEHEKLISSAKDIQKVIDGRIKKYEKILPKCNNDCKDMIKKSLILESYLNKPRSFTTDGRPCRDLLTNKPHKSVVEKIKKTDNEQYEIKFNKSLTKQQISLLEIKLGKDFKKVTGPFSSLTGINTIRVSAKALEEIESVLYPKNDTNFGPKNKSFTQVSVLELAINYDVNDKKIKKITDNYFSKKPMAVSAQDRINLLGLTTKELQAEVESNRCTDKGYIKHLIKNFEFEIQNQLDSILPEKLQSKVASAFNTALKLDCIQEFNDFSILLAENIEHAQNSDATIKFLEKYGSIDESKLDTENAKKIREEMLKEMRSITNEYKATLTNSYRAQVKDFRASSDNDQNKQEDTPQFGLGQ